MIQSKNKPLTAQQLKGIRAQKSLMLESMRGLAGVKGEDGLQGVAGTSGDNGKDGINGAMGESGRDGARGPAGPRGPVGARGEAIKGDTGEEGQDGKDGRGIKSTVIVGTNLIITYTDGTRVNVGRVVGHQGRASFVGGGSTDSKSAKTIQNKYKAGEAILGYRTVKLETDGLLYMADNTALSDINKIIGISTISGNIGADIIVLEKGFHINSSLNGFSSGAVFAGLGGLLVQARPLTGFIKKMGFIPKAGEIQIELAQSICLN